MDDLYPPEVKQKIDIVRFLVGDTESSVFFPLVTDDEIYQMLIMENMNVGRAARRVAMSISFNLSMYPYRERTGDIEVWNNASIQYLKTLQTFLKDFGVNDLNLGAMPYFGGIRKDEIYSNERDPNTERSRLITKTKSCSGWWTTVIGYDTIYVGEVIYNKNCE